MIRFRKHFLNVLGVIAAVCLYFFAIWQLDLICVEPVWDTQNFVRQYYEEPYARVPFQCFLWHTTVGRAYDTLLLLDFLAFWILFFALWFWEDEP
jgi:hypothetical protein